MGYGFWADVIVGIHLGYVAFVLVAQLLIVLGWLFKWQWVRNPWFRVFHFLMIAVVAFEAVADIECPLTVWEYDLRKAAGQENLSEASFIGRLLHETMFFDNRGKEWIFTTCYVVFALLVLATLFLVPPRWRRPRSLGGASQPAGLPAT